VAGRVLDLGLHLLDRQVLDTDGGMVCNVDDLELTVPEDGGPPYVSAILCGPAALGPRLGGLLGRWLVASSRLLGRRHDEAPDRVPFALVNDIGSSVVISRSRQELGILGAEDTAREYVVERLPGARRASE
jgi:sporulation protein YlmC with PRC-barrel domain